jgi:NodT family efflux transporter outer membrane factor (OMF) lipoprotein
MASVLAVGCTTVGPDYTAPELNPPIKWNGENSGQITSDPLDPAALNQWWTTLQDPLLTRLINNAVSGNLNLRDAESRIRESRARRGVRASSRFPTLNASGNITRSRISETSFYDGTSYAGSTNTLYAGSFDASWEVDLFGRIQRQVEAAQAGLEASEENYRDVLVTLLAEVALNYLEVRTQQARLEVARENLESQTKTVDLVRTNVEAGETSRLDLEQALTNLETTRSTIPSLESSLAQAKNRLAILLGQPPGSLEKELVEYRSIPLAPPQVAVGVPADVLRRRPDIRQAERTLAAATAKIGVATADLYPSLTLFGSIGIESLDSGNFLSSASRTFGINPSLQWNLFDAGRIRNNHDIVSAQQEQALIAYEAVVLNALRDVEDSIVAYGKEMVRRQALVDGEQSARRALAIAQDQYKAGETDFLSVLEAQRSLLSLQDQLAASNGQVTTNVIRLFKALGGGWSPLAPETTPSTTGKNHE